ncbi:MAG: hypothetical protein R3336_00410 [Phycisphaeraceae bacterium]|nr:hypothetical protein [Phycisphaeraceae bacterium]
MASSDSYWPAAFWLPLLLLVGLVGCGEEDSVRQYTVVSYESMSRPVTDTPEPPADPVVEVTWKAPATWEQAENPNTFRVATYQAGTEAGPVEVAISRLEGDGGGILENLNRWRGQLSLPPVATLEEAGVPRRFVAENLRGALFDIGGGEEATGRMLVAPIRVPGQTWFVKATGPPAGLAEIKARLWLFLKTFRVEMPSVDPPDPPVTVTEGPSNWQLPAGWRQVKPSSPIITAAFEAGDDPAAKITATLTALPADAGGELVNVNRWRRQLDLPPVASLEAVNVQVRNTPAGPVRWVSLAAAGDDGGRPQMVVAWRPSGSRTWFFKMVGPAEGVAEQIDAYWAWVGSIRIGADS